MSITPRFIVGCKAKAAKRFRGKAIKGCKDREKSCKINTDKAGCYSQTVRALQQEGKCPKDVEHRQVKYLNNVTEADHGKLKQLIKPMRGFQTMKTAYATIKGFEGERPTDIGSRQPRARPAKKPRAHVELDP